MPSSSNALKQFLDEHSASEISTTTNNQQSNVIELDSNLSPMDAASILWTKNIVGAPVWDDNAQKYVGFFELRDILSVVIASAKSDEEEGGGMNTTTITNDEDASNYKNGRVNMDRFDEHMVKELAITGKNGKKVFAEVFPTEKTISYLAARNQFAFCTPEATLTDVCECLNNMHCHRVPILNNDGKCQNIISQSALISYIFKHCPRENLQEKITESGIPYKKDVVSIVDTASATDAFTLLDNKRLSGIAVVDEDGKLVGNTSARDIKLAAIDEGKTAMDTDILSYLAKVRQAVPQRRERYPSCHIHENVTVAHVIELLAKTGYHRVFVVDDDVCPIGVISVTDITIYATKNNTGCWCV